MLVLTRKKGESIQIGNNIEVTVIAIEGEQIKLGIDAPQSVDIHRQEVYHAIQQQNSEAVNADISLISLLNQQTKRN